MSESGPGTTNERLIAAAQPIFALCQKAGQKGEISDTEIAAAAQGAITILLAGVFALVSIADAAQKIAKNMDRQNGIWDNPGQD